MDTNVKFQIFGWIMETLGKLRDKMLHMKLDSMVALKSLLKTEQRRLDGWIPKKLWQWLMIHQFQVLIHTILTILDCGDLDHKRISILMLSTLVTIRVPFKKDKKLNISLVYSIQTILLMMARNLGWNSNTSFAQQVSMISLEDIKRIMMTNLLNSHQRIEFNLMIHIQLLEPLNFLEFWLMKKTLLSKKLGRLFTKLLVTLTTLYSLRRLRNGQWILWPSCYQDILSLFIMLTTFILSNYELSIQMMMTKLLEWVLLRKAIQRRLEWLIFLLFAHMLSTVWLHFILN